MCAYIGSAGASRLLQELIDRPVQLRVGALDRIACWFDARLADAASAGVRLVGLARRNRLVRLAERSCGVFSVNGSAPEDQATVHRIDGLTSGSTDWRGV